MMDVDEIVKVILSNGRGVWLDPADAIDIALDIVEAGLDQG